MPKTTSNRSFTACWTCRRRNIRGDTAEPECSQCRRACMPCEGYKLRLGLVDSETGTYIPRQRRAYACDLTWKGYPKWTWAELDHLINNCEKCDCPCSLRHDK